MKRLIAAGMGAIYQIGPAFREGEWGRLHHPEFTMLEWYRPHWTMNQLMMEVVDLIKILLPIPSVRVMTFQEAFTQFTGVDPFTSTLDVFAQSLGQPFSVDTQRSHWVDLLFVERLEPAIAKLDCLLIITGFPPWEPGMAELDCGPPEVARRFEVFFQGVEMANGYQELQNPDEQEQRLKTTNAQRVEDGEDCLPIDEHFLAAMRAGFPPCAGVALGLDRLLMLAFDKKNIAEVMAFREHIPRLKKSSAEGCST